MIIARLSGGMGNQMFQYALGRALSLKYRVPLKLDTTFLANQTAIPFIRTHFIPRPYALDVFAINATVAQKKDIPFHGRPFLSGIIMQCVDAFLRKVPLFPGWEKRYTFDKEVLSFGPDAYLVGFWQSEQYFKEYEAVIRNDFVLKNPLSPHCAILREEIRNCESVCIHVRRADFATTTFHGAMGKDYYEKGLVQITERVRIEKLYVFSDDIDWCKQYLSFDIETLFVDAEYDPGKYGEGHLALMSTCKHFIIPNSTFSWWAAWLGTTPEKVVVAPKKWFAEESIDTSDLIPSEWIRI